MKRLYKKKSFKIIAAAAVLAGVMFGVSQFFSCCQDGGAVIAKVNGKKIYESQVQRKLASMLGMVGGDNKDLPKLASLPKPALDILVREVYFDEELAKLATKSDAAKTEEVKARIRESKNNILRQVYIESVIKDASSEEKVNQKYTEFSAELLNKKEYLISHIIVKNKEEAEKIQKEIASKKLNFATAAKKYSLDKDSAVDGGKLGFVLESNLIGQISTEISKLKKDEVSAPIQTEFGWHIIKFSETRDAKALPFEEVKENVRQQLIKENLDEIKNKILKDVEVKILTETKEVKAPTEAGEENVKSKNDVSSQEKDQSKESESK